MFDLKAKQPLHAENLPATAAADKCHACSQPLEMAWGAVCRNDNCPAAHHDKPPHNKPPAPATDGGKSILPNETHYLVEHAGKEPGEWVNVSYLNTASLDDARVVRNTWAQIKGAARIVRVTEIREVLATDGGERG